MLALLCLPETPPAPGERRGQRRPPASSMGTMERSLLAAGIVERDETNDVLGVWSYPGVDAATEQVTIARSCLASAGSEDEGAYPTRTVVSRYGGQYVYQCTRNAGECKELAKVTHFSVYVIAKDFHPELFMELARVFAAAYAKAGDPVHVLQAFLSVFARGAVGSYNAAEYDIQQSMVAAPLKQNIALFGESFILLWVAMLLKKRIVVYCDEAPRLLEFLRCLPLLVWHRKYFDCLCPFVQLDDAQLEDLASQGAYCAGFTDDAVKVRSDLYDVIVDLPAQTLNVNDKAKTDLGMGEFHRNLGSFLAKAAANDEAKNTDIVKGMHSKTAQLFKKLTVLKEAEQLNLEALEAQQGVSRSFARFLYNVAVSENMC